MHAKRIAQILAVQKRGFLGFPFPGNLTGKQDLT